MVGLDRLSETEREALRLLGEGHTAKSIAALTGRSVAAVNERLRDARRKTGASSSRELARLLKAEKAGDEKIEVANPPAAGGHDAPLPLAKTRKGLMMSGTLAIAAIAAAIYLTPAGPAGTGGSHTPHDADASASVAKGDPLLGTMFPSPDEELPRLYARLRSEPRDPAWADRAEAALRSNYARLPHAQRLSDLRIICASSLCEVAGAIRGDRPKDIGPPMQELQDWGRLNTPLLPLGLKMGPVSFGSRPKSKEAEFVVYWLRSPG